MATVDLTETQPLTRRKPRPAATPARRLGRLAARVVTILLVAGLIGAGATAVGYSPLRSAMPGTFLPVGEQRQGPPPGLAQGASRADQTSGAAAQADRGPQSGRSGNQAAGASQGAGARDTGQGQGSSTGRNARSLQRGWREELDYLVMFAVLTAVAAIALRLFPPSRARSTPVRLSTRA